MYLTVLITIQKADVDPGTLVFNFLMMDDGKIPWNKARLSKANFEW